MFDIKKRWNKLPLIWEESRDDAFDDLETDGCFCCCCRCTGAAEADEVEDTVGPSTLHERKGTGDLPAAAVEAAIVEFRSWWCCTKLGDVTAAAADVVVVVVVEVVFRPETSTGDRVLLLTKLEVDRWKLLLLFVVLLWFLFMVAAVVWRRRWTGTVASAGSAGLRVVLLGEPCEKTNAWILTFECDEMEIGKTFFGDRPLTSAGSAGLRVVLLGEPCEQNSWILNFECDKKEIGKTFFGDRPLTSAGSAGLRVVLLGEPCEKQIHEY